ncbi:MAG TPA: hypothetical protein VJ529_02000 [Candidatus Bathyarchaeia archaeon]|nr:hypothetical protein [Candidatus Bathyarchaeia archaeon]
MKTQACQSYTLRFLIAMSLAALVLVLLVMIFPPITNMDLYLQKQLIGTAFVALCVGGIMASLLPGKCTSLSEARISRPISELDARSLPAPTVKGHHPNCGRFSDHTVQFRGTVYCAACLGLAAGSLVALAVTAPYFFLGVGFSQFNVPAIVLGESGVLIGFIQTKFKGLFRLLANLLFVVGGSLIIVGLDEYAKSLFVDLFLVGAVFLWIFARIALSQEDHHRICASCGFSCRMERKGS